MASNSITERGIDMHVGPLQEDLLAYELQVGNYYHRGRWIEDQVRHRELYRLATTDAKLLSSRDAVPLGDWLSQSGLATEDQFGLGFAMGSSANAWEPSKHPHLTGQTVELLLDHLGLADRKSECLVLISTDRAGYLSAFDELAAGGKRLIWELRPFQTYPLLRVSDGGLLLIGRPWLWSWLSEGFHYRPMKVAQELDRVQEGRSNHVQRFTAYAGQVFEHWCLGLAHEAFSGRAVVQGEQLYAKGSSRTTDVAVLFGEDLILFEANARRVGALPLVSGDPLDATGELGKLIVKKINQLGVCVGALLAGEAELPGVDLARVKRIWPIVVAGGHVWQTRTLWTYLDETRDAAKCSSFEDPRVQPLQLLDADDYEMLMALAQSGSDIPALLARKTSAPWRHRDLAVWLNQDTSAPDHHIRLESTERAWAEMTRPLEAKLTANRPGSGDV